MGEIEKTSGVVLIGAGLARTGTNSTKKALEMILPGKCYHMLEARAGGKDHFDFWGRVSHDEVTDDELREFLQKGNYVAGLDYPFSPFYLRFMKMYPEAKVLLTVRDPVKWYLSVKNTIFQLYHCAKTFPTSLVVPYKPSWEKLRHIGAGGKVAEDYGIFGSVAAGEAAAVKFYNEWVEDVKKNVPEDRLLVFHVSDGWEPLCKFLNVPVPDAPFPNVNDTESMRKRIRYVKRKAWGIIIGVPVVTGGIAYAAWKIFNSK
eukprot:CAMPEP_0115005252 /NCGR_PEP_ID=MMETSP0216-20121206/19744_1 /TAXON_ID=223996 /ORGANISM="Protocruzia adherens, Strain Boccale" /LENGTH=259 /DNA_ID=CAMNT_0002371509 /DNA_START=45 /DNA_END=824 /DNA_ORIENTATION=-